MPISLSPHIQTLIEERLKRGGFPTADHPLLAALDALDQQPFASMTTHDVLAAYPNIREKIEEGFAAAEAGNLTDGEQFFAGLECEEHELHR